MTREEDPTPTVVPSKPPRDVGPVIDELRAHLRSGRRRAAARADAPYGLIYATTGTMDAALPEEHAVALPLRFVPESGPGRGGPTVLGRGAP